MSVILDLYLWLWPRMQLRYCLRRCGFYLGLALLLIGPLLYINVDLIRKGFKPSSAGLQIEGSPSQVRVQEYYLPEGDD